MSPRCVLRFWTGAFHAFGRSTATKTEALGQYRDALKRYDLDGDEPKPVRTRYRMGDPTLEAVVHILEENPRGVLLARDELAAWLGSFDRYAHGAAVLEPPERFLQQLPPTFTTDEVREVADAADVPERTIFRWLDDLQESGALDKLGRGRYRKRG